MAERPELGLAVHVFAGEIFAVAGAGPVPEKRRAVGIVAGAEKVVTMEIPTAAEAYLY